MSDTGLPDLAPDQIIDDSPETPEVQPEVQDRKAALRDAFDKVEAGEQAPGPEGQPAPDRVRDDQGRFAKESKGQVKTPAQAQPVAPVPGAAPAPVAQPWQQVPESWKPEMRGHWPKVSPEVQQYWHEREAQMRAGVEPLIPKVQLADAINQAAAPYMARIQSLNLDLPRAVAGLMKVDHDLTTLPFEQKVQLLVRTAAGYGVDLTGQAQAAVQTYNPMVEQLQNKVAQLEGRYHTFEEQQKAAQDAAAQSQIQQFSKTAEHFEAVKPLMAKLLQGFMADDLQSAYDMAVRLSPDIFDKLQASKQAAADAEKRKAADEAAKRARAHAVSIKGSTPGVAKTDGPKDRRSVLREAFDNLSERL